GSARQVEQSGLAPRQEPRFELLRRLQRNAVLARELAQAFAIEVAIHQFDSQIHGCPRFPGHEHLQVLGLAAGTYLPSLLGHPCTRSAPRSQPLRLSEQSTVSTALLARWRPSLRARRAALAAAEGPEGVPDAAEMRPDLLEPACIVVRAD